MLGDGASGTSEAESTAASADSVLACAFTGIVVRDLSVSRRFYVDGLGFEPVDSLPDEQFLSGADGRLVARLYGFDHPDAEIETASLSRDGKTIRLMSARVPAATQEARRSTRVCGLHHLSIYTDDADELLPKLEVLGGTVLEHTDTLVKLSEQRSLRMIFVLDPDGDTRIELVQDLGPSS